MTQARPYLAARSLKGLEVKFEMIEREGEEEKKSWKAGMFIGCSWASLEQYEPGLKAGSECVRVCASADLCAYICARMSACLCSMLMQHACERRVMRYRANTERKVDFSKYMQSV